VSALDEAEEHVRDALGLLEDDSISVEQSVRLRASLAHIINAAEERGAEGERDRRHDDRERDREIAASVRGRR
jgi:hypothetical protein